MDLGLKEKTALVAGSSKGLGRAIADELAREGVNLVICARNVQDLELARQQISDEPSIKVIAVPTNLSEPSEIDSLIATAKAEFGRIDILITNTGGPPSGPFENHSREVWEKAVQQNFYSVLNLTREVLPDMREAGWGRIINVTSVAVKQPVDGLMLSNSIRAAVTGFAKTLATEEARFGITINNVMPGYTKTDRLDYLAAAVADRSGITPEDVYSSWENQTPVGRIGHPSELAALVTFLASERASFITGASIPVDGGYIRSLL
jgi:3-oxoacyl-[acyl-carrier protein] reductase